jgi:hypothetical protein
MTILNYLKTIFSRVISKKELVIWSVIFYFLSLYIIYRNTFWFDGDESTVGTFIQNILSHGADDWYFYGQEYFGVISFLLDSVWAAIFGNSPLFLRASELFWYCTGIHLLLRLLPDLKRFEVLVYGFIFTFPHRFYLWTFSSTGWGFIIFITCLIVYICHSIYIGGKKLTYLNISILGFLAGFSLYHNVIYYFVFPVTVYLMLAQKSKLKQWVIWVLSVITGLIPFVLAIYGTSGRNLKWFENNKTSSIWSSIRYVFRDIGYFYLQPTQSLASLRNILGLLVFIVVFIAILLSIRKYKTNLILIIIGILSILPTFLKDYYTYYKNIRSPLIFEFIRYNFIFYTILIFTVLLSTRLITKYDLKYKFFSIILIISLCVVSLATFKRELFRKKVPFLYEQILPDLQSRNITHIYCGDFYYSCGVISYFSGGDIKLEPLNDIDKHKNRLPQDIGTYDNSKPKYYLTVKSTIPKNTTLIRKYETSELPQPLYLTQENRY